MVKNIIFDLGGVIYELDFPSFGKNMLALQQNADFPSFSYSRLQQPEVFTDYEIGRIDTPTFRDRLRQEYAMNVTSDLIDRAWNSLLVGVFSGRANLLNQLKQKFRLALLSNINQLHLDHIQGECKSVFELFDRCFFSNEMGCRKPELAIFRQVLEVMNFCPEETLFIDDSPQHVEAAKSLGIRGIWLEDADQLQDIIDRETN